jgi:hypothetical protein
VQGSIALREEVRAEMNCSSLACVFRYCFAASYHLLPDS